jgi:hypothetical protein
MQVATAFRDDRRAYLTALVSLVLSIIGLAAKADKLLRMLIPKGAPSKGKRLAVAIVCAIFGVWALLSYLAPSVGAEEFSKFFTSVNKWFYDNG